MNSVAVLLATYNGEERLQVQLNSLQNQSCQDFTLYIHDDGSSDSTLDIIHSYQEKDRNLILLDDDIKHRGAKESFMWLLEHVAADYYMFCDQDDLWLPSKIEQSLNFIKEVETKNPDIPVCIHTDLAVADGRYNVVSKSLWSQSKVKPAFLEDKDYIQVFNCVTGCTMIFNQRAKECSLTFNPIAPMHDFWVAYQTLKNDGMLTHLPKSTMLYCQHENNVVGANNIGLNYFANKLKKWPETIKTNKRHYKEMKKISGISLHKYMFCKISYEIIRLI